MTIQWTDLVVNRQIEFISNGPHCMLTLVNIGCYNEEFKMRRLFEKVNLGTFINRDHRRNKGHKRYSTAVPLS